jgi:hypothetical protein
MKRTGVHFLIALISALVLAFPASPPAAHAGITVCYVDKDAEAGDNNGSSWVDAYLSLQSALTNVSCNEIWVAEGVYIPGGDKADTFLVNPGVAVYGGFAGTETYREERLWKTYITVLSGDIYGDDTVDAHGITTDYSYIVGSNNYHVVTMDGTTTSVSSSTVLDGLTITAGNANNAVGDQSIGGGLLCKGNSSGHTCSPTLAHISFNGNFALQDGGALYNAGNAGGASSPGITSATFGGNHADYQGGAIYNAGNDGGSSSPTIAYGTFTSNSAGQAGGAMYNEGASGTSSPVLLDAWFEDNSAGYGGAIDNNGGLGVSSPTLVRATFYSNSATHDGGAVYNNANAGASSPSLTDVIFYDNSAVNSGGALFNSGMNGGDSSPTLTRVLFWYNRAEFAGGAMNDNAQGDGTSSPTLTNVTFVQNQAHDPDPYTSSYGGAIYNISNGSSTAANPVLTNATFNGNSAMSAGGAIYNSSVDSGTTSPALTNVILWGDTAGSSGPEVENNGGTTYFNRSVVQGGCPAGSSCTNILITDPRLGVLGNHGGYTYTIPLLARSSAIDTAIDGSCPSTDERNLVRPQAAHCDIGAFEVRNGTRADFDGEGISDMGYFRASSGLWGILHSNDAFNYGAAQYISWGQTLDISLPGDFDGDSLADPAIRRPPAGGQSAAYMILTSSTGYDYGQSRTIPAGWPGLGDTPVVGDFNGDGLSEPAIWRGNTGVWIIPLSPNYTTYSFYAWGQTGDTPIGADVDGDGQTDIGYWRPSTGVWGFLRSSMGYSYAAPLFFSWGTTGDIPVMADYDGDRLADPAVDIPATGGQSRAYRILLSTLGYDPAQSMTVPAGWPGLNDTPVPGDYDGDGKADAAIWRGNTGVWIIPTSSTGNTFYLFAVWGAAGDVPAR